MAQPVSAGRWRARVAVALDPGRAWRRGTAAAPAAAQLAVATTAAYAVARLGLQHPVPILAVTVCLSSLGFVRDARPRRVVETAFGLSVGIALAELVLLLLGRGLWQVLLVLFVTLLAARVVNAAPPVAVAAAAQSAIVLLIQLPAGGVWARSVDGLVGGAVALLATALLPRDPRHAAQRDADRVFAEVRHAVDDLARALQLADRSAATAALLRLRRLQPALVDWTTTVDSAVAIARVSPFLRGRSAELRAHRRLVDGVELAVRSLRTVARRAEALLADGRPSPRLAELLLALGSAIALLGRSVRDPAAVDAAREDLLLIAARLDPRVLTPDASLAEATIIVLVRPMVVDLAAATGVPLADVRALLPPIDERTDAGQA